MKTNGMLAAPGPRELKNLMETALGRQPADIVVENARIVNVYTGEILENFGVSIKGPWIAHVGPSQDLSKGPATRVIDARGKTMIPGLIEGHTHIGYLCPPGGFVEQILQTGTTSVVTETMEPGMIAGLEGVLDFMASLEDQPVKVFFTGPAMVSHSPSSQDIRAEDIRTLAARPDVVGLGESYWQSVLQNPDTYLPAMVEMRQARKTLEGHSAGASGKKLSAYAALGITSCHEPIKAEEVLERLRLGFTVMLREGGIRRDLETLATIRHAGVSLRRVALVTDSVGPEDLISGGYLDRVLQKAMDCGFDPVAAIQMVTLNVAEHFRLDHVIGGIAPGRYADLVLLPDIRTVLPHMVISNGTVIVEEGNPCVKPRPHAFGHGSLNTVSLPRPMNERDFLVLSSSSGPTVRVRVIDMVTDLVTAERHIELPVKAGEVSCREAKDILKVAAVDRKGRPGKTFVGFIRGFGLTQGAMACSAAWDTCDIIVVGENEVDMAAAVNRVHELQGGFVISRDGQTLAELALPLFGVMSLDPVEKVASGLKAMTLAARNLGVSFPDPLLSLITLTTPAIPYLRICEEGLVNLKDGKIVGLFP